MSSQKGFSTIILILGVVLISGLIIGGSFYIKSSVLPKQAIIQKGNLPTQEVQKINKLLLFYDQGTSLGKDKVKYFKSDISGNEKVELDLKYEESTFIGPFLDGRFLGKTVSFKSLEIAESKNPNSFKQIAQTSNSNSILNFITSSEKGKIAYLEFERDMLSRKYKSKVFTVNIDGTNTQLVRTINEHVSVLDVDWKEKKLFGIIQTPNENGSDSKKLVSVSLESGEIDTLFGSEIDKGFYTTPKIHQNFHCSQYNLVY